MSSPNLERRLARVARALEPSTSPRSVVPTRSAFEERLHEDLARLWDLCVQSGEYPPHPPECHDSHRPRSRCLRCRAWRDEVDAWVELVIASGGDDDSVRLELFVGTVLSLEWGDSLSDTSKKLLEPTRQELARRLNPRAS